MELAHSLLLNEEALKRISDNKRPVFIYEWLRFLDKVLIAAQKSDIKHSQKQLVVQLTTQISESPGPPTRKLLARCLATLFSVGDTTALFETINKCNDIVRNKDDSPSYLPTRLAAVACIGGMYERLGRMVGRSYEETISLLIKALKNAESQGRSEIMLTLEKVVCGLGSAGSSCYKDIYKAARNCLTDRSMNVRCAAAKVMHQLVIEAPFMYTTELDNVVSLCLRALDGSNYDVRCVVGKMLGLVIANTQNPKLIKAAKGRELKLTDVLNILANGFVKGGTGFLKGTGEMIKGTGNVNREIRVGVTHAYLEFLKCMGGLWLERNISEFLTHVVYLVANPRATPTHVDAVYARKCVQFILRNAIGGQLSEKAQIAAAREISQMIVKEMNATAEVEKPIGESSGHHVIVCCLHELGSLVQSLGTSASPLVNEPATGIIEPVVSVLIHHSSAARLTAAWCLRCIAVALPSQLTPLLDRCMSRMTQLKSSPEAVTGYSFAIAALLGGVYMCPLGIPHAKGKQIFGIAEELLRTASQNSRLSLQRTMSGWLLLGAFMSLGPAVVKNHLPRMLLLWKNSFPRSSKELESEKARGDAFTWQVTLEGRAGALSSMKNFIRNCPELVTEDVTRRLLSPLQCALKLMEHIPSLIKHYGAHLKACAAMVRLRLYDVLSLLPPKTYEGLFSDLLRELVAEFTLTDNPANTTTSMLRAMCHHDDSVILGSWLEETDHKAIEDQLQPNSASGSGALEHDATSLYTRITSGDPVPGPLPLGVAVIDGSVTLFGFVFPRVPHKHRLQMLEHFSECIKQAKSTRQQAMQMNIFAAVISALKGLADNKIGFGQLEVRKAAVNLVLGALGSNNPILRCAAGEAIGRLAQVVEDNRFIAEMAQYSFDKLKSARDVVTRTGHSLALGCLHRYVGGMGAGQHLNTSVSILLALAQDTTSPIVQVWSLHALGLIADSGGPMYRGYVEPSLSLVLQLLLSVPPSNIDVHQCLGKCLAALITTIGPELQGNTSSISTARMSCLVCCAIMQDHPDSQVQAEAISCLQQLHMFAPRHVNLSTLVPHLCETLKSSHLLLRRAAVACLRQLSQREAKEVCEHAMTLLPEKKEDRADAIITETGLEGALFRLLDTENDKKLISDLKDTLVSMLQTLAGDNLGRWILLLKDVLQATSEALTPTEEAGGVEKDDDDDDAVIQIQSNKEDESKPTIAPRWPTRVFATECLQRILTVCEQDDTHVNLATARDQKQSNAKADFLVLHLSELVRMAFMASTSDSDSLRLAGLAALQDIIVKFAKVPEPEFPGHVILEQYQAQVGAALRPAFSPDTASDVTATACEVCSTWIGSGVARDLNDLRRVHQLLVSSLAKLKTGKGNSQLYSESASTMEKLAVLKAWAEVYIEAMDQEKERLANKDTAPKVNQDEDEDFQEYQRESLLSLVQNELGQLSQHWLGALKDHALLSLPQEFSSQLPAEGGAFYHAESKDSARSHYKKSWAPILYAVSLWLSETGFIGGPGDKTPDLPANMKPEEVNGDRFYLLLGISIEALCSPTSTQPIEVVTLCLKALSVLLGKQWPRKKLGADQSLGIELLNVLHRLLLTRENVKTHLLVMEVVQQVIVSIQESLDEQNSIDIGDDPEITPTENGESDPAPGTTKLEEKPVLGDGGSTGEIIPGKSAVFAALEVCLCVLIRQIPVLNPSLPNTGFQTTTRQVKLTEDGSKLVSSALTVMADLPQLCSPKGTVSILPTVLFLTTNVVRELAAKSADMTPVSSAVTTALQSLRTLCSSPMTTNPQVGGEWVQMLQSAMATVIEFSKPGAVLKLAQSCHDPSEDRPGLDDTTSLLTLAVFITSSPKEVSCVPNLQAPSIEMFNQAWTTENQQIKLKCLQTLTSIFQRTEKTVSTIYIHSLTPMILEWLTTVGAKRPTTELEMALVLEGVKMMEALIAVAENDLRIHMVMIFVPTMISYLLDHTQLPKATKLSRALHDCALQKLMTFGPQYPNEFRTLMGSSPELRARLETAIKAKNAADIARKNEIAKPVSTGPVKPAIKLKMDFSNFSG
ncbi:unnamed protein product [Owenia fusiformis]|uniref:HEAT repeat-containing protein 5A n=1 Tax=Owenia fusiformis TaxID=6347 RepID=A0A8S4PB71_OWEFU|nr:unnamed protein product [Owenia fusiformis]